MTERAAPVDVEAKIKRMQAFISGRRLKNTKQRDLIAAIALRADGHIGVEEIFRVARKKDPKVGFSTVYRTMKLLKDCGLVIERHFGDGVTRYEPLREGEHHDHLICTACGLIVEFEDHSIEERQDAVALRHGFVVQSHKHEIYGLCPRCAAKALATESPKKRPRRAS
jgi:Fur family transcriptional regulator, ferric uptake regulator